MFKLPVDVGTVVLELSKADLSDSRVGKETRNHSDDSFASVSVRSGFPWMHQLLLEGAFSADLRKLLWVFHATMSIWRPRSLVSGLVSRSRHDCTQTSSRT